MSKELFICERCNGINDVAVTYVNDVPKTYCLDCRVEMFSKKRRVGRPTLGVTKKVSLTLEEKEWQLLDEKAEGNRSAFIRETLLKVLNGGRENE